MEYSGQYPDRETDLEGALGRGINKQDGPLSALLSAGTRTYRMSISPPEGFPVTCQDHGREPISPLFFV